MTECVIVLRTKTGDEIIAILNGELDGIVKTAHPYYVRYNPMSQNIAMVPYCALSDEKYYEFRRDNLEFLVTANRDISTKFLKMVDATEHLQMVTQLEDEQEEESESLFAKTILAGNDTKH